MGAADAEEFGTNPVESRAPGLFPQSLPPGAAHEYLHAVRTARAPVKAPEAAYGRMSGAGNRLDAAPGWRPFVTVAW